MFWELKSSYICTPKNEGLDFFKIEFLGWVGRSSSAGRATDL